MLRFTKRRFLAASTILFVAILSLWALNPARGYSVAQSLCGTNNACFPSDCTGIAYSCSGAHLEPQNGGWVCGPPGSGPWTCQPVPPQPCAYAYVCTVQYPLGQPVCLPSGRYTIIAGYSWCENQTPPP
jgi:hypothetical protein